MEKNAYITLLSTNNYLYGCIGLMYSWKATNPKYPFYCVVTEDITQENIRILEAIGYKVIVDKRYIPASYLKILKEYEETGDYKTPIGNSTADLQKNGWQYGWTKLQIFKYTQFNKLLYVDADSYVVQNLDFMFDLPGWSSICEYDAPWTGQVRLHSAFFLIEPDKKVYTDLLQLAEDNPLIPHPVTGELQLSNDYDLLNLYKKDWCEHPECIVPNYTFLDSFTIRTSDFFFPFLINSFTKVKAIHLTGEKPWLRGTQEVANYCGEWGLWKELYLIYIKFLNKALEDICHKGIASLPLIN
jgi:lipopolysaccharide biosynthesis glycosyltransferase